MKKNLILGLVIVFCISNSIYCCRRIGSLETQQEKLSLIEDEMAEMAAHIESLKYQVKRYKDLIPFNADTAKITGIVNNSQLEVDPDCSNSLRGEIYLRWDNIPNASGYQIEFNYKEHIAETAETYYFRTGIFTIHASEEIKVRIRAYGMENGEMVFGEFSDWITLEIE